MAEWNRTVMPFCKLIKSTVNGMIRVEHLLFAFCFCYPVCDMCSAANAWFVRLSSCESAQSCVCSFLYDSLSQSCLLATTYIAISLRLCSRFTSAAYAPTQQSYTRRAYAGRCDWSVAQVLKFISPGLPATRSHHPQELSFADTEQVLHSFMIEMKRTH